MYIIDDRRIRKTKKALREALAELILKKDLRNITVRELTDTADIHRATFYTHYQDIYDLYEQVEDAAVNELSTIIVSYSSHAYKGLFSNLIDHIYDNSQLYRMFLDKRASSFRDRVSVLLEEKYLDIWKYETGENETSEELWFLTRYHIQGFISMVIRWIESDFNYPKDKLTDIIFKIDSNFDKIV